MSNYTSEQIKKHGDLINIWEKSEPKPIIQYKMNSGGWRDSYDNKPTFDIDCDYRVKPTPTREEITAQWVKDNNLKVGDKVKVIKGFEEGFGGLRKGSSDDYVGRIGTVYQIRDYFINILATDLGWWAFPVECLEKVKDEYVPFTFEDNELFRDKWVKRKDKEHIFRPVFIAEHNVFFEGFFLTYQEAFEKLEFIDKTLFGKKL